MGTGFKPADKWTKTQEMMDVLYQCEDLRDFLNELSEMKTRGSGFMGTGFKPAPKIENIDELAKDCATQYNHLLETHPAFKPRSSRLLAMVLLCCAASTSSASPLLTAMASE